MMKTRVTFLCLALIFSGIQVFAQLSKAEKKEWKKKAKEYSKNPSELKSLIEAKQATENDNSSLKSQISTLNGQVSDKNAKIADLEDQLSKMRGDLTSTKAELAQLKENPPAPAINPMDFSKGVVFKVQIGAFKNKDLAKYFDNNPNFGGEATDKGEQRFTIGVFRDYWEADKFKKYMREMGVKDAWIVPFKDGQRVEIKDVLEGVVSDKAEKANSK
jgi:TolA-binding protein